MACVVFIHGLNTYGDENLHFGPANFGLMHKNIEGLFTERGIDFVPLHGLGAGSPDELADRAVNKIAESRFLDQCDEFYILGQSIGGLVARALAARPELSGRVRSIFTTGTPHHGSDAARFALEFEDRHPLLFRAFKAIGYDVNARSEIFRHYLPENIRVFNERYPVDVGAPVISLICEVSQAMISWPIVPLHWRLRSLQPPQSAGAFESDGFILTESQRWGESIGLFELDHMAQLGFFFHLSPTKKRRSQAEFERLIDTMASRINAIQGQPQAWAQPQFT
jgi:pimeloyl-ACP methyl ester carboxylesterase